MNPTGSRTRCVRASVTDLAVMPDGTVAESTRTISGTAFVVIIRDNVPGIKPADIRRQFVRACRRAGCSAVVPCERNGDTDRATGENAATAFLVFIDPADPSAADAVNAARGHWGVASYHLPIRVSVPRFAAGSGPDKVRPAVPTAFSHKTPKPDRSRERPERVETVGLPDVLNHIRDVTGR